MTKLYQFFVLGSCRKHASRNQDTPDRQLIAGDSAALPMITIYLSLTPPPNLRSAAIYTFTLSFILCMLSYLGNTLSAMTTRTRDM